ncbi:hypothetical protein AMTR_s00162p00077040 [Amborella trichopoda]|uniref:Seipin-2-like n=2 Tax=Amborella trichopoda TaxID=13333 RepID=W1PNI5_AMBTC|nr:hypothetical protein AMTR_s00162p00077040 [Amborella trichopoda]
MIKSSDRFFDALDIFPASSKDSSNGFDSYFSENRENSVPKGWSENSRHDQTLEFYNAGETSELCSRMKNIDFFDAFDEPLAYDEPDVHFVEKGEIFEGLREKLQRDGGLESSSVTEINQLFKRRNMRFFDALDEFRPSYQERLGRDPTGDFSEEGDISVLESLEEKSQSNQTLDSSSVAESRQLFKRRKKRSLNYIFDPKIEYQRCDSLSRSSTSDGFSNIDGFKDKNLGVSIARNECEKENLSLVNSGNDSDNMGINFAVSIVRNEYDAEKLNLNVNRRDHLHEISSASSMKNEFDGDFLNSSASMLGQSQISFKNDCFPDKSRVSHSTSEMDDDLKGTDSLTSGLSSGEINGRSGRISSTSDGSGGVSLLTVEGRGVGVQPSSAFSSIVGSGDSVSRRKDDKLNVSSILFLKRNESHEGIRSIDSLPLKSRLGLNHSRSSVVISGNNELCGISKGPFEERESEKGLAVVDSLASSCLGTVVSEGVVDTEDNVGLSRRYSVASIGDFLVWVARFILKSIEFQLGLFVKFICFPIWLLQTSLKCVIHPFQIVILARESTNSILSKVYTFLPDRVGMFVQGNFWEELSIAKLVKRIGWGCFWSSYVGSILILLFLMAFFMGGIVMQNIVEKPIQMTETLNFDYTMSSPVAISPIKSCCVSAPYEKYREKLKPVKCTGQRLIPANHKLQLTISLTLPESDYNRKLGVFQVAAEFISKDGTVISRSSQPCMLRFKSPMIHNAKIILNSASLIAGYAMESQTLQLKMEGFTEGYNPTACIRVTLEQRAGYEHGAGIPEIYAADMLLESELPLLKRIISSWKITIFIWVSTGIFVMQVLAILVCCRHLIFPSPRPRNCSANTGGGVNSVNRSGAVKENSKTRDVQ